MPGRPAKKTCSELLRVLADPVRLRVLTQLLAGPRNVQTLNDHIGVEQSLLSHHLKVLRQSGLVATRREGKRVVYRLAAGVGSADACSLDLGCCVLKLEEDFLESHS